MIGGIIMAAGLSERIGGPTPKQLLPVAGRPMVATTVANAVASRLDRVVVVTGHRAGEVAAAVDGFDVLVAENPDYREGNMTSLRAGYRSLPDCAAYVVLLADMPGVTTGMIDSMIAMWQRRHPWAAVAAYRNGRGHPLLLSADAMAQAAAATGPKAVWRLLDAAEPDVVVAVEFATDAPRDVNTAADYEALLSTEVGDSAQ